MRKFPWGAADKGIQIPVLWKRKESEIEDTESCIMNINTSVNKALNVPSWYWSLKGTYLQMDLNRLPAES